MNKDELKKELNQLGINQNLYSLDGELNPDSIVLIQNYTIWEVFYLDERGSRNKQKVFHSEAKACEYIYSILKESNDIAIKFNLNK